MRALFIDLAAKKNISNTVQYALQNRISRAELLSRMESGGPAVGDDESHCCYFQTGFKSVFSIEEQPFGWSKHLSVSVADIDKMPNVESVKMIMEEFGINKRLEDCYVYIEESSPKSINIIAEI